MVGILISSPLPRRRRLPAERDAPTSYSRLRDTRPPSTSEALAVVPPMSKVIAFSNPRPRASESAATTPAAGPDSSAKTGRPAALSAVITPPDDCMIVSGAGIRRSSSPRRMSSR